MAVSITAHPDSTPRPAGQHLVYTLYDSSVPDRYVVQVYRSTTTSGTGSEQAKLYLTPNANDRAHFDISKIAEGIIEYPLSKDGVAIHAVQDAAKVFTVDELALLKFQVRAGQYNGTTESLNEANDIVYLLRGVEQISAGLNPSFSQYYPTGASIKGWLTDRERSNPSDDTSEIQVSMGADDQAVGLIMLTDNLGQATSATRMRIRAYSASGSYLSLVDVTVATSTTVKDNLLCVPIGPAHWTFLGLPSSTATAKFRLENTSGNDKCVEMAVTLDETPCKHEATQLAWINSRGGWDYLRFDSRAPKTIAVTGKEYRKAVGSYGAAAFTIASDAQQYDVYGKTGKERYTLQEQFFTADERELLQYLMQSQVVQMRTGTGNWEPCIVRTNSLQIQPQGSQFYAVSLEVEIARDVRC